MNALALPNRRTLRPFFATALLLGLAATSPAAEWAGSNGLGGDGTWTAANFSPATLPGSSTSVYFRTDATRTDTTATVSILAGTTARTRYIYVQDDKQVTINFEDTASLISDIITVGANTFASNAWLTLSGPETGSATITAPRLWLAGASVNLGTLYTRELTLDGNLTVHLTTSYTALSNQASLTITGGASITTDSSGSSGQFQIFDAPTALRRTHLSVLDGSLSASQIQVEDILQLDVSGQLTSNSVDTALDISVKDTGRFEAAGDGLTSNSTITVNASGTVAVGLADVETGEAAGPATFTLQSHLDMAAGSVLEFNLFASGQGDSITLLGEDALLESKGSGALIQLILEEGYTPEAGFSWSLFDVNEGTGGILGNFNLSLIDTDLWDLTDFNEAGGWTLHAVPEPGSVFLLTGTAGMAALILHRRRRASRA